MVYDLKQKIVPCLWFDKNCEEAINFYTSIFKDSKINMIQKYPDNVEDEHMKGMEGKILTAIFELNSQQFMALDGGPLFKFTPAISFFVNSKTEKGAEALWKKLSEGGSVMMEFGEYPFAKKYGWCADKFGLSWQVGMSEEVEEESITPALMYTGPQNGKAQEAMDFYTSLFKDSEIVMTMKYEKGEDDEGNIKFAMFKLAGQNFSAMDSGIDHKYNLNEAVSLVVDCVDQEETDYFWNKMTADGGEESQCGWLKDKFGVSWQIVPKRLGDLLSSRDKERSGRVMQALLTMKKIDVKKLQEAYEG